MKKIAADRNYKIASALPKGSVRNPDSYTFDAGTTYLHRENPNMPKDFATLYVVAQSGEALAISSIRLTKEQKRSLEIG